MATITYIDHWAKPELKMADIAVNIGKKTLNVVGKFREQGVDYDLEEEEFHLTSRAYTTYVTGWLVIVNETGELRLFVDEEVADGVDEAYRFRETGLYQPLFILFQIDVPPKTHTFEELEVRIHRVLDRVARDKAREEAVRAGRVPEV